MTREVANWFHDREGELFTVDETPFTRDELVQVVDDSVDPVQQVLVDGEKYVGVIQFEEHDGWYEYTRWSDSAGEVRIGVCARCVQQAETPAEVSRTIGDSTEIAQEKFENHYEESHESRPDEVNTGATLLSGTTINGNTAIHPGMDGHGSGVDADFVLGNEALETGSFYSFSETTAGEIQTTFSTPSDRAGGVGLDSNNCIWHASNTTSPGSIYELDQTGSIMSQFTTPSQNPVGVGINSNDCIWSVDSFADSIYKLNQSGSIITSFSSPSDNGAGIDVDSSSSLWHADNTGSSIYELDTNGTILTQFSSESSTPTGLGVDDRDSLWVCNYNKDTIREMDRSGSLFSSFSVPGFGDGVGIENNGSLWHSSGDNREVIEYEKFSAIEF